MFPVTIYTRKYSRYNIYQYQYQTKGVKACLTIKSASLKNYEDMAIND